MSAGVASIHDETIEMSLPALVAVSLGIDLEARPSPIQLGVCCGCTLIIEFVPSRYADISAVLERLASDYRGFACRRARWIFSSVEWPNSSGPAGLWLSRIMRASARQGGREEATVPELARRTGGLDSVCERAAKGMSP